MRYQVRFAHGETDRAGTMVIYAETDSDAIRQVREFAADGFRDSTWASLALPDGTAYVVENVRGGAVGHIV